ncbi:MAG TPA: hypothetical protein VHC44_05950, partial [Verrucomicrobiae bacterium]|nr:hypothetical protein [Verrucomicrobiae bacterium]
MKSYLHYGARGFAAVALSVGIIASGEAQTSNTIPVLAIAPDGSGSNALTVSITNAMPGRV